MKINTKKTKVLAVIKKRQKTVNGWSWYQRDRKWNMLQNIITVVRKCIDTDTNIRRRIVPRHHPRTTCVEKETTVRAKEETCENVSMKCLLYWALKVGHWRKEIGLDWRHWTLCRMDGIKMVDKVCNMFNGKRTRWTQY